MAETKTKNNNPDRDIEVTCGALIGVSVVATVEMLGTNTLDNALIVSLVCFAASIPTLAWIMVMELSEPEWQSKHKKKFLVVLAGGSALSITGMGAVFFHFSILVGIVFSVACVTAIIAWLKS